MGPENRAGGVFRYCPKCGAAAVHVIGRKLLRCDACGFELYLNVAAAVAALIFDDEGRLLAIVRAQEPQKGLWDLPGGFVDPGESAEDALRREIREELGLEIASMRYLQSYPNVYEYRGVEYATADLGFVCTVDDLSQMRPAESEIEDVVLERPEDIDVRQWAFPSTARLLRQYLDRYTS